MSSLSVQEKDGVLVVDSRLIAIELGIKHGDWMRNIVAKYKSQTEQAFGFLRFEHAEIKGRGQPEKFVYLTEEQSLFFMTLSRNTERVVECKIQLVKAFSEAKKLLEKTRATRTNQESNNPPPLPSARERLETIRLGMDLFTELGGWDERTAVLLKDQVRNILLEDRLQPSSQGITNRQPRLEYPVSDRAGKGAD